MYENIIGNKKMWAEYKSVKFLVKKHIIATYQKFNEAEIQ